LIEVGRVYVWLAQGGEDPSGLAAAERWASENQPDTEEETNFLYEFQHLALAQVLISLGTARPDEPESSESIDKALALLRRLLEAAEREERTDGLIRTLALQAIALQAQGDHIGALSSLERALSLAEPEGYVRVFVDKGPLMEPLLRQALSQGIRPAYVQKLLAALGESPKPTTRPVTLPEPPSERELEVLRLVAAGLSNREIAETLVIAVSTVKSHLNHVFGKLGVRNRTQAVAKARELGLL
jgi:LuxR family maltose regulon positive regulatory protein